MKWKKIIFCIKVFTVFETVNIRPEDISIAIIAHAYTISSYNLFNIHLQFVAYSGTTNRAKMPGQISTPCTVWPLIFGVCHTERASL